MKHTIEERLRKALAQHPGPWDVEPYTLCERGRPDRTRYTVYDRDSDMCDVGSRVGADYIQSLRQLLSDALGEIDQLRTLVVRKQVEL